MIMLKKKKIQKVWDTPIRVKGISISIYKQISEDSEMQNSSMPSQPPHRVFYHHHPPNVSFSCLGTQ